MSRSERHCDFDWVDGENPCLKGGSLLGLTEHRFSYAFFDGQGRMTNGFVAALTHGGNNIGFLTTHPEELACHLGLLYEHMGDAPGSNIYLNDRWVGGLRVENHPHMHVLRRDDSVPAAGMGLGLLVKKYNDLHAEHLKLRDSIAWRSGT